MALAAHWRRTEGSRLIEGTLATILTFLRILLIAPFAALFFIRAPWAMNAALGVFVLAAATDFLDGFVARARRETSALGAALDPLADKLLIAAAIILLVRNGAIRDLGILAALAILLREVWVSGLREALAGSGEGLPVTPLAKWKTTAQLVAIGLLLAAAPGGVGGAGLQPVADLAFWIAALLTLVTGAAYSRQAMRLLRNRPQ